jgi:hypothetical protein
MPDGRPRPLPPQAAWAFAATAAVVAACCCIRLGGWVNAVGNSPAEVPLLLLPFLLACALGYEAGPVAGLIAVGALAVAMQ